MEATIDIFQLLQLHTINLYDLRHKQYEIKRVPARSLLNVKRFDLFAKLYYIRHSPTDREKALRIYTEHIKAFNPDNNEPGRTDKTSLSKFVEDFNTLIETFRKGEFDEQISLIPIDRDNIILDGSHRVATLAYYDKDVTIVRFNDIRANIFDYDYFKKRGLSWDVCDVIAVEMTCWLDNLKAACIWPRVKDKQIATEILSTKYNIGYIRNIKVTFSTLVTLVRNIYKDEPWASSENEIKDKATWCYGRKNVLEFVLMDTLYADTLVETKKQIRDIYGVGDHSIHITDNIEETLQLTEFVFSISSKMNVVSEFLYCLKYIHWLRFKVFVASLIHYNTRTI